MPACKILFAILGVPGPRGLTGATGFSGNPGTPGSNGTPGTPGGPGAAGIDQHCFVLSSEYNTSAANSIAILYFLLASNVF